MRLPSCSSASISRGKFWGSTALGHKVVASCSRVLSIGANLTCAQIATLMQTAPIDSTRLQLATTLWPRAVDPQNFPLLMLALEHEGSRTLLRQQTGH